MLFTGDISELRQRDDVEYGFVFQNRPDIELIGYTRHKYKKYNVHCVRCTTCEKDPELFGAALFTGTLSDIRRGRIPCGCAGQVLWEEWQWKLLAKRASAELGFSFEGWADEEFKGSITYCRLLCSKHGMWTSNKVSNLVLLKRGCPSCGNESKAIDRKVHKNAVTAEAFFATGKYHPDTVFKRLGSRPNGLAIYWSVECPVCNIYGEAQASALKRGVYCCGCTNSGNQNQAYINIVYDNDLPIAIKFGITYDLSRRVKEQKYSSIYRIENIHMFYFDDRNQCRAAEKYCKNTLVCGIIPKEFMKSGFSETTSISNLNIVRQIFLQYGGVES